MRTRFSEVKENGSVIKIELLISLTLKYLSIRGFEKVESEGCLLIHSLLLYE